MSIRDYFDAEMRLLHEAAQSFAEAYPEQARHLNLKALHDRDPTIERLLEGFAFLTGQIRQRIDDDLPDVCYQLLQQSWPQILSPLPSLTILEFSVRKQQLHKTLLLPRETMVQSAPVGGEQTACRFVTATAVKLNPILLLQVQKSEPSAGGSEFKFHFQLDYPYKEEAFDLSRLRLYLHTDPAVALELYWALTGKALRCEVDVGLDTYSLEVTAAISEKETLLSGELGSKCFHLLQDYFAFREKYLFIELHGLEKINSNKSFQQFVVKIHCQHIFSAEARIEAKQFRLHCVPAINLYSKVGEPIQVTQERYDYPLVADVYKKDSIVLQNVEKVTGLNRMTGERCDFHSLSSYAFREKSELFYQINQRDGGKEFPLHYLVIAGDKTFAQYDVMCQLKVSNGYYPRQYLHEGTINEVIDKPNYVTVTNLTRPTMLLLPPKRKAYVWQLISCLSFNSLTLTVKENLQELLKLFEWTNKEEQQRKIDAIYEVSCVPLDKIYRGAVLRGVEMNLSMNEEGFRSLADIYLFGCVLQQFFRDYTSVNFFVQTRIHCHPSQREFLWEHQHGYNPSL